MCRNKAIFLDRDGTINIDKGYVHNINNFDYLDNMFEGLLQLQTEYKLFIVTNQSGIARGYYKLDDMILLHEWLIKDFNAKGIKIEKIYFCPHHPEGIVKNYRMDCNCRKPKIGLFLEAAKEYNINLDESLVVGDKLSDFGLCDIYQTKGFYLGKEIISNEKIVSIKNINELAGIIFSK